MFEDHDYDESQKESVRRERESWARCVYFLSLAYLE